MAPLRHSKWAHPQLDLCRTRPAKRCLPVSPPPSPPATVIRPEMRSFFFQIHYGADSLQTSRPVSLQPKNHLPLNQLPVFHVSCRTLLHSPSSLRLGLYNAFCQRQRTWTLCIFLSEEVKDYIKSAKAHIGETCQKMDSDLSMMSHYVDVQVSQRHVANRCTRNSPKTLDNELVVMGDTDRKQSLLERTQVLNRAHSAAFDYGSSEVAEIGDSSKSNNTQGFIWSKKLTKHNSSQLFYLVFIKNKKKPWLNLPLYLMQHCYTRNHDMTI